MVAENEGKEGVWRSVWADGQLVGSISVERKAGEEWVQVGRDGARWSCQRREDDGCEGVPESDINFCRHIAYRSVKMLIC